MEHHVRTAVYAGSFDPLTNGHLWMIKHGLSIFGRLIVAVGENPEKQTMFSVEERLELLRQCTTEPCFQYYGELSFKAFNNRYLVHYARSVGAYFTLRGIRNDNDFQYERTMCNVNSDIDGDITTVFLTPPPRHADISSSMVKAMLGPEGWERVVAQYVPAPVLQKLREKYHGNRNASKMAEALV